MSPRCASLCKWCLRVESGGSIWILEALDNNNDYYPIVIIFRLFYWYQYLNTFCGGGRVWKLVLVGGSRWLRECLREIIWSLLFMLSAPWLPWWEELQSSTHFSHVPASPQAEKHYSHPTMDFSLNYEPKSFLFPSTVCHSNKTIKAIARSYRVHIPGWTEHIKSTPCWCRTQLSRWTALSICLTFGGMPRIHF